MSKKEESKQKEQVKTVKAYTHYKDGNVFKCVELDVDISNKIVYTVKVVEENKDEFIIRDRFMGLLELNDML